MDTWCLLLYTPSGLFVVLYLLLRCVQRLLCCAILKTIVPVSHMQAVAGNALGGTFALELEGYVTDDLAFDVSADALAEALENLGNVGTVSVTRSVSLLPQSDVVMDLVSSDGRRRSALPNRYVQKRWMCTVTNLSAIFLSPSTVHRFVVLSGILSVVFPRVLSRLSQSGYG